MKTPINGTDKTREEWREFARTDRCLEQMVPSDLRCILVALYTAEQRAAPLAGVKDPEGLMSMIRDKISGELNFGQVLALYGEIKEHLKATPTQENE